MLFEFLKYISPAWYFNLNSRGDVPYFPDYDFLTEDQRSIIDFDPGYSSLETSKLDAAYQGFRKGIISCSASVVNISTSKPTIVDNYRFAKKYFNQAWVYYIFLLRIFSLKNPFKEITGLIESFKVRRINLYNKVVHQSSFDDFDYTLIKSNPFISVIIPTLNRYSYLKNVLLDLENQTYKNFEVIIIDQSEPYNSAFYMETNLDLVVKYQQEKALWLARNSAIKLSKGDYILLYDDDSRVEKDWIVNHLKCIEYFEADISAGVSLSTIGAKIPKHYSFFRWSDQIDTGNVMIQKHVFKTIGLFDRQFEKQRQGDGEFGLRAYLAGFKIISNPKSHRIHLKISVGGLREMGSWDAYRPKKFLSPRPIPSVLYMIRKYFGTKAAIYTILINVPPSLIPYRFKRNKIIFLFGLILNLILMPVIIYTVIISWRKADEMLRSGSKIESLS